MTPALPKHPEPNSRHSEPGHPVPTLKQGLRVAATRGCKERMSQANEEPARQHHVTSFNQTFAPALGLDLTIRLSSIGTDLPVYYRYWKDKGPLVWR